MLIQIEVVYGDAVGDGNGNPSAPYSGYGFETENKTFVDIADTWYGALLDPKPADVHTAIGTVLTAECVENTTTRVTYTLSGYKTYATSEEVNSLFCGYVAPPAAGTFVRFDCLGAGGVGAGVNRYRIDADGAGGEVAVLVEANSPTCGYVAPAVLGCMDEEASNYDPLATEDNGTCVYEPRLDVSPLPRLAALGRPLLLTLQSVATGETAARARLLITLEQPLATGTVLTIEGESFELVAAGAGVGEFNNATTLAIALASSTTLSARYRVSQLDAVSVELLALATGSQLTPVVSVSAEDTGISLELTPGVDGLRSQSRAEWGCYVEVWAVPGATWGAEEHDLSEAYLVDKLEQLYQVSNRYEFDLSPALLPLVGHALNTAADRVVGYFVRFGEVYRPAGEQLRQRKVVADTDLCFGLESATVVPAAPTTYVLSTPMPGAHLPLGKASYPERVYVLAPADTAVGVKLVSYSPTGEPTERLLEGPAAGGVEVIELSGLLSQVAADALLTQVHVLVEGESVLSYRLLHRKADVCLQLLSQRGTFETVWLTGLPEPTPKRTPQLYSQGSSQAVRRVELSRNRKLFSGPLSRAGLDWLCAELAGSSEVRLLEEDGTEAVIVTGFSPNYNQPENSYSLTLDVEPAGPTYTLSN